MASVETLRQTWADVLGIEASEFGDDDNFMDCMKLFDLNISKCATPQANQPNAGKWEATR